MKIEKIAGYCKLCRQEEMRLYNTVLSKPSKKHVDACKSAGCLHPPVYVVKVEHDRRGKNQQVSQQDTET